MQFQLPFSVPPVRALALREQWLRVGPRHVRLWLVPNRRARRYVLRVRADGSARLTVPRGGTATEAIRFAEANATWLERQLLRHASMVPQRWTTGTRVLLRGEETLIEPCGETGDGVVRIGLELIGVRDAQADVRPEIERHLWQMAARELPPRVLDFAAQHNLRVQRISVRNQRSRWGSCSRRGTISLNWRLVQAPLFVRDYIILHELAHLKEMNHSRRFWAEVERLCPDYSQAELWLKANAKLLR